LLVLPLFSPGPLTSGSDHVESEVGREISFNRLIIYGGLIMIKAFNEALQDLYNHVGFVEDWVVYPVDDRTEMFWKVISGEVKYAETMEEFNSDDDYYVDSIYTQRFYDKHIWPGEELTMIFVNTHTDGNKFFAFYHNDKEITED
jgi:hypothetical protein